MPIARFDAAHRFSTRTLYEVIMFRLRARQPRTARTVFGGISDSRWLRILKRSVKQPLIKGVRLPGFPPRELQSSTVGTADERTLDEAFRFYTFVTDASAIHGVPIRAHSEILDFGVSWGRIIRFFMKDVDPERLHGVDTSSDYLRAARETAVPGQLHQIDPLGQLPYREHFFDLVYAYSVFTHLPEHVQTHWLAEIARTLKPGALLVATVEPPRFLDFFAGIDPEDRNLHPWHADMARKIRAAPNLKPRLRSSGYVYIPTVSDGDVAGEVYGDCVMTPEYVRRHWSRFFDVVEYLDDADRFWQAVVVARKR